MDTAVTTRVRTGGRPVDRPRKSRRVRAFIAVVLAAGLGVAGCGGGSSSGTASGPAGSGGNVSKDTSDPLVKYSQCMRSNGVPSFPDPVNGRLQLQVRKGSDLDPSSPQFQAAQTACKSLDPAGLGKSGPGSAEQEAQLKYVTCMRKNGVPNFPDPTSDGRILLQPGKGLDPNSSTFKAAQETCRKLLPGGVAPGSQ